MVFVCNMVFIFETMCTESAVSPEFYLLDMRHSFYDVIYETESFYITDVCLQTVLYCLFSVQLGASE